jgi:hypothetical protein
MPEHKTANLAINSKQVKMYSNELLREVTKVMRRSEANHESLSSFLDEQRAGYLKSFIKQDSPFELRRKFDI